MPYKKNAIPGTVQFDRLAAKVPEGRILKHRFNSDMTFENHNEELITKVGLIDCKVPRNCQGWMSAQN